MYLKLQTLGVGAARRRHRSLGKKLCDLLNVGFLVTGGFDVPISPQFTATAGVNAGFLDKTNVELLLGIGYNF